MIVFSFIVTLSITCYLLWVYFPFYLEFNRTVWCKKSYSITLWMITSGNRRTTYGSAKGVFTLPFRNEDRLNAWDDAMFDSGKYQQYRK